MFTMTSPRYPRSVMMFVNKKRRKVILGGIIISAVLMTLRSAPLKDQTAETLTRPGLRSFMQQGERIGIPFLIQPKLKCNQESERSTVITVLSKTSNLPQREVIRQTWGCSKMQIKYNFRLFFVIGTVTDVSSLNNEVFLYGDIIQVDIPESYYNIVEKTIATFQWVTELCFEPRFFFKMDDDVYFDLEFLKIIQNNDTYLSDDVIHGTCVYGVPPYRYLDAEGDKFKVSIGEYPFNTYPPYCGGPGYFMTSHTANKMYLMMKTTRSFKFEDVYVGMVACLLQISVETIDNFVYEKKNITRLLQKVKVNGFRVVHGLTLDDVQYLWDSRHLEYNDRHA
ncbi:UDP-GalNAc:beta-1,3-N-acetylgalactosaminyltransferase 1-like [Mizuhopecten yessoensis]|nr:UDP-GalNAc:beta-1,3-N-acetylgalactosaminyltransferase 1-like [Mizuhopecten yessoensis]XP_021373668.1 UDP-GalNAc:beta-1,3-N-acetylgalactosaminyltransferase 1-like [Mizuhopecten yessoensis]XP_021373669.1 UDP-GalNAc:beta-1,3-N-acetylgalactosaminyltransferase 1-like [Mizuhopecten yessoensis]